MHITVFGASGKVGQLVVAGLIRNGHSVTAFVHSHAPFEETKELKVYKGDIHNQRDVVDALQHADAVVSALGSWGTKEKDVLSSAMRIIIPAMEHDKIKRIVSLTGNAIVIPGDRFNTYQTLTSSGLSLFAGKIVRDGKKHILALQKSSLDWTCLRSPVMDDNPVSAYLLDDTPPRPWDKIGRKSVAKAMCDLVESDMFLRSSPFIH